jgi:hypothetical protein
VCTFAFDGDLGHGEAVEAFAKRLTELHLPRGRMRARAKRPPVAELDICHRSPEARFRGPENQLYRVEIIQGGRAATGEVTAETATFAWSRENGSVAFGVSALSGARVTLASVGRDGKQGLEVGDRVQLVDDASVARQFDDEPAAPAPPLFEVLAIDVAERIVTLDADPATVATGDGPVTGTDPALHPLVRRWDQRLADGSHTIPIVEDEWIPLEDGVEVLFPASGGELPHRYRRGDHWLIPARTVTGDIIWPQLDGGPRAEAPHGVDHHYAPLAHLPSGGGAPTDLRITFAPRFP